MLKALWIAGALTLAMASSAVAQEIVVTGSRIQRNNYDEAPPVVPSVTVARRADNLIVTVWVVNDTREAAGRRSELMQTLRNMARAAASQSDIDLSIEDDGQLVPFTEDMISTLTLGVDGGRSDTSMTSLVIKTPIRANDTMDTASGRIEQFVARIEKSGRSLVTINGGWQLSIVNPNQYRLQILAAISEDARATAATFGDGYAVEVSGLANTLTWVQSGPLDLAMFVPYQMTVTPRP